VDDDGGLAVGGGWEVCMHASDQIDRVSACKDDLFWMGREVAGLAFLAT
jgi:hypothetical protein